MTWKEFLIAYNIGHRDGKIDEYLPRDYPEFIEQEPCDDEYIKVPKKALKYRTAGMIAYNAEWLKNHFDLERAVICGAQEPCDAVSREAVLRLFATHDGKYLYEAIRELPPVQLKPIESDDAISRQLVKASLVFNNKTGDMQVSEMRKILEIIDALPSVHPEYIEDYCPAAFKLVECEDCISRQTVLDSLEKWWNCKSENDDIYEIIKAIPSVTPAEKQEPCEDCVSRKELLKIYEDRFLELQKIKYLKDNKGAEDRQMGVNYCINILKETPPVTPAEKVGHWVDYINDRYICDSCSLLSEFEWHYCPNCGAKMEEE